MACRRTLVFLVLIVVCLLGFPRIGSGGDEWLPIDPAELQMTSEPKAPGAPAIYLYRQLDRDDQALKVTEYARIKILTEEGRSHADIEVPFVKDVDQISNVKARTIRPDGTVVEFDGKVYEKTIVKTRGVKYLVKTFTLPDVQVGSIIEYRYALSWSDWLYDSHWILSADLFTKHAKFSLKPNTGHAIRWIWHLLPQGTATPVQEKGGLIRLEARDIPAFQEEDFAPPPNELKARVDFIYGGNLTNEPDEFWKREAKYGYEGIDNFVNKRKAMEQAANQIVSSTDSPEVKLQKIYARVQQLRNTSFEAEKSQKEMKREKQRENSNVEDVWKNQYGSGGDITWLFLGLVRGAGFEAYPVWVSRRDKYFFKASAMDAHQLDDSVVLVKSGGKDLYFDPGTAFTPYGYLPWAETAVKGMRIDKEGGTWVQTTLPASADSVVTRVADLIVSDAGAIEGKLTVTYSGLEALGRRMEERNDDDADKKKYLEDEVKGWVPVAAQVELTNKPEWKSSAPTLVAEFSLKADGWASPAGRRFLIPVGFFTAQDKHLFEHANRVHPVYFEYPFEAKDQVNLKLPANWSVTNRPPAQNQDLKVLAYSMAVENKQGVERITRALKVDFVEVDVKSYGALRNFFQQVKSSDEQQIVVQPQ